MDLGTDKISLFLSLNFAPNPVESLKVVHVGGTNGKGSVCALISSTLQAAGYKVGIFNSPHLVDLRDAIRINQRQISLSDHLRLRDLIAQKQANFHKLVAETDILHPTYPNLSSNFGNHNLASFTLSNFEVSVVEMLLWFQENSVDIAVLEVGIGGAKDATNIFDLNNYPLAPKTFHKIDLAQHTAQGSTINSLIQVLCPIGLDHLGIIGNNIQEITAEKMGIARNGAVLIVGRQPEAEALQTIINLSKKYKLDTVIYSNDSYQLDSKASGKNHRNSFDKRLLVSRDPKYFIENGLIVAKDVGSAFIAAGTSISESEDPFLLVELNLHGNYQADNAATAYYAIQSLLKYYNMTRINDAAIQQGFKDVLWPGRLSWFSLGLNSLNTDKPEIKLVSNAPSVFEPAHNDLLFLVDGAHNPPAAKELADYVQTTANSISTNLGTKKTLAIRWICAFTRGRDISEIFSILLNNSYSNSVWAVKFTQPSEMPWITCTEPADVIGALSPLPLKDISDTMTFETLSEVFTKLSADQNHYGTVENCETVFLNVFCGSLYMISNLFQLFSTNFWKEYKQ